MLASFHKGNRERLYAMLPENSLLVLFSGEEQRKTNDEFWPFYADRSFVYLTGIAQKESVLLCMRESGNSWTERLYLLPSDPMAERWTGRRLTMREAEEKSGIRDIRPISAFSADFHTLAAGGHYSLPSGHYQNLWLDLYKASPGDGEKPADRFLNQAQRQYPYLKIGNANALLRRLRLIKQPCEIEAMRKAESITREGILAMMRASKPGMWEYQYKAEFDRALGQFSPDGPAFPSIISSGENNFCIHYYSYTGQAQDGDMILNDVGAQWDNVMTDVSRGFPCNGRFTDRQRRLWECVLATSNHMFGRIKPGFPMAEVDAEIRRYNAERLVEAGALDKAEHIGRLMWHGGAHHVGWDVHDVVERPETVAPGMVFCIDVGVYHEEWGIGFRLEDNLLVTETGCENLSAAIPRTVEDIEAVMRKG